MNPKFAKGQHAPTKSFDVTDLSKKEVRLSVYEKTLEIRKKSDYLSRFLCDNILTVLENFYGILHLHHRNVPSLFPELLAKKPADVDKDEPWWDRNDKEIRDMILKEIIKKMKNENI